MSNRYSFVQTNGFDNGLANIEKLLLRINNTLFSLEVNNLIGSLDKIETRPRERHHWDHHQLVYRDDSGNLIYAEELDDDNDDSNFDQSDMQRIEYVVEMPIQIEDKNRKKMATPAQLIVNYSVNDNDMFVYLLNIEIVKTY